jgi:cytochrome c oxidase subunit II
MRRRVGCRVAPVLSLAALLLAAGADAGPFSGWHLPPEASTYAPQIDSLFMLILWITGIVFFAVEITLIVFLIKYRHREGRRASYVEGNNRLEVIWTIVPALILVFLAVVSQRSWANIKEHFPKHPFMELQITAEQFAWNITYPGPDGKLGTNDDIHTLNELHLPLNEPVTIHITSKDVIHSFFVPLFRIKQDAVPGMQTKVWVQATEPGNYEIACAELCGLGHYRMRGYVTVQTPAELQKWLVEQARAGSQGGMP